MRSVLYALATVLAFGFATAPTQAKGKLTRKAYQVVDLLRASAAFSSGPDVKSFWRLDFAKKKTYDPGALVNYIRSKVNPASWREHGGNGTIDYFPLTTSLVICQTEDAQKQIEDLLTMLRRDLGLQSEIQLTVRLMEVSEKLYQQLAKQCSIKSCKRPQSVILSQKELVDLLTQVQKDKSTNVLQAPRVTVFDDQKAKMDVTEKKKFVTGVKLLHGEKVAFVPTFEEYEMGFRLSLHPRQFKDKVKLSAECTFIELATPKVPLIPVQLPVAGSDGQPRQMTQYVQHVKLRKTKLADSPVIPDGSSALIVGTHATRKGTTRRMMLVTSRIIRPVGK